MPAPLHVAVAVGSVVTTLQASKVVAHLHELHHNMHITIDLMIHKLKAPQECNTDRIQVEL